jgi:pyruvate kinase
MLENIKKLPDHRHIPVMFDIKHEDIMDYFVEKNLDVVALSFTERAAQIDRIRQSALKASRQRKQKRQRRAKPQLRLRLS